MNAHSLRALSVGSDRITHHYSPRIGAGGGQKAKSRDVAAGEEAISPTELGVWVPTQLEIGQNMGWHRGCSDAYRDRIRHSRQPNRV